MTGFITVAIDTVNNGIVSIEPTQVEYITEGEDSVTVLTMRNGKEYCVRGDVKTTFAAIHGRVFAERLFP